MQAVLIAIVISVSIQVRDYPYSDDPVYLIWQEDESGFQINLAYEFEGELNPLTEFVEFPGMFNSAKADAHFEEETRTLYVYSQYPFSANYYLATYRLGEDGLLCLLEAGDHNYYYDVLERVELNVDNHDMDEACYEAGSIMYPGNNPYSREMCALLLKAGLQHADSLAGTGVPPDSAVYCFEEINSIAYNLAGVPVHRAVPDRDIFQEEFTITMEEYLLMLEHYADLLESAGNLDIAEDVRSVREEL